MRRQWRCLPGFLTYSWFPEESVRSRGAVIKMSRGSERSTAPRTGNISGNPAGGGRPCPDSLLPAPGVPAPLVQRALMVWTNLFGVVSPCTSPPFRSAPIALPWEYLPNPGVVAL